MAETDDALTTWAKMNAHRDCDSLSWLGQKFKFTSDAFHPFPHVEQAVFLCVCHVQGRGFLPGFGVGALNVEPFAVVLDHDAESNWSGLDAQPDFRGGGVFGDVVEGLFENKEDIVPDVWC